jgi:transcription initiation factor TFIID subunit 5
MTTNRKKLRINNMAQVIEYLSKKGYSKTEAMLRMESANTDREGRPLIQRAEDLGGDKYFKAFGEYAA